MTHKHSWLCESCGNEVMFEQPEIPQENPRSEQNEDRRCACGEEMYFDEIAIKPSTLVTPKSD